jgi:hypothetical protein
MKESKVDLIKQTSNRNNAEDLESNFSMSPPELNFGQTNNAPAQLKGEEEEESMQMKPNPLQMKGEEEEESMQMKANPAQLQGGEEEEEPLQGKMNPAQLMEEEEEMAQTKMAQGAEVSSSAGSAGSSAEMPANVQAKMEDTMGADFSGVNIHKDSDKATNVGALAYAQGNDVHFAPGQFKPESTKGQELIGHELAHVVQQREGRVQSTMQKKGMNINNDPSLEREADQLGAKAANKKEE